MPTTTLAIATDLLPPLDLPTGDLIMQAMAALIHLDARVHALPPLRRTNIVRAICSIEAAHSAALDDIHTTPRHVITDRNTGRNLVAANAIALTIAAEPAEQLTNVLISIHKQLLASTQIVHAGRPRAHTTTTPTGAPTYTPPEPHQLAPLLNDLDTYVTHSRANPLATAALAYGQVGAIMPFATTNERAARAWITTLLTNWHLIHTIPAPVGTGLNRADQARALDAYRDGNPAPIVATIAQAILHGVAATAELVNELTAAADTLADTLAATKTRADSTAWDCIEHLIGHPITTASYAGTATGNDRYSGWSAANKLADTGIIAPAQLPNTPANTPHWQAPHILAVWEQFWPTITTPAGATASA